MSSRINSLVLMMKHIFCIFLLPILLYSKIWIVDTVGKEGDSLQKAINETQLFPGIDTVLVKNGTYHLAINLDTILWPDTVIGYIGLIMLDSVVLMSESDAERCTLTALSENFKDTAWHVIWCDFEDSSSYATIIKGFTIKDGNANASIFPHYVGGGVYCRHASLTIQECKIIKNSALYGGGFYLHYHSGLIIKNNIIEDNNAKAGGGIFVIGNICSLKIEKNTISNNSAKSTGGGIDTVSYTHLTLPTKA